VFKNVHTHHFFLRTCVQHMINAIEVLNYDVCVKVLFSVWYAEVYVLIYLIY